MQCVSPMLHEPDVLRTQTVMGSSGALGTRTHPWAASPVSRRRAGSPCCEIMHGVRQPRRAYFAAAQRAAARALTHAHRSQQCNVRALTSIFSFAAWPVSPDSCCVHAGMRARRFCATVDMHKINAVEPAARANERCWRRAHGIFACRCAAILLDLNVLLSGVCHCTPPQG